MMHHVQHHYFDIDLIVPSLRTPPKAKLVLMSSNGGGSNGLYSHSSVATLNTEMAFADLVQAYEEQFSRQGWQELVENHGDESALSTWQLSKYNSVWTACFNVAANPGQNGEYMLWLNVYGQEPDTLRDS